MPRKSYTQILVTSFVLLLSITISTQALAQKEKKEYGSPLQHQVHIAYLNNSQGTANHPSKKIFDRASSPEIIKLTADLGTYRQNDLLLYFTDFSEWKGSNHTERLSIASSNDNGQTWSQKSAVVFDDEHFNHRATDASLVQLTDGRLRLYFMTPSKNMGEVAIMSATSSDAINFTLDKGVRLLTTGNPEVTRFNNQWYMFCSDYRNNQTHVAVSDDGLDWQSTGSSLPGSGSDAFTDTTGKFKIFLNQRGIKSLSFNPTDNSYSLDGFSFHEPGAISADPSMAQLNDNTLIMVYKYQEMKPPHANSFQP